MRGASVGRCVTRRDGVRHRRRMIGHVQTADGNEPESAAQVKAAFLFNFTKFVEWPEPSDGSLIIGIAGDDDFAEIVAFGRTRAQS